jgi:RHS repeat-associated protein
LGRCSDMAVMNVSYLTVRGQILSETRNGVESDYIPDPLGSTAALIGASQTITDTFSWWPFGEQRSHTGSSVTPFGYGGTLGYYTDLVSGRLYVRANTLRPEITRWQSVDPFWPSVSAYAYVNGDPVGYLDPMGTDSYGEIGGCSSLIDEWNNPQCQYAQQLAYQYLKLHFKDKDAKILSQVMSCIAAGESGCKPTDGQAHGRWAEQKDRGLYSICSDQWCRWGNGSDFDDKCYDANKNTRTAVNMIVWLFQNNSGTIAHRLCAFGVLYCKDRIAGGEEAQNAKTMCCLQAKGLLGIYKDKPPQPL